MQKITPYLWFESRAEEAANHYVSSFPNSKIVDVQGYGEGAPLPAGTVMMVTFELQGQRFKALNGGPLYTFNEAISFYVDCASQEEVDEFWARLSDGGEQGPCGRLKDRFGVSWQVIPEALPRLLADPAPERAGRVMQAMFEMQKIDIKDLQHAYGAA
jgi:predicted 3-demethylubiquinone-9 3-methyltransferase (glyoxalase superfamily)